MKLALKLPTRRSKTSAEDGPHMSGPEESNEPSDLRANLNAPGSGSVQARFLDRKRMIRVTALLFVAAAAGQIMQSFGGNVDPEQLAEVRQAPVEPETAQEPEVEVVQAALAEAVAAEAPEVVAAAADPVPVPEIAPANVAAVADVAMIPSKADVAAEILEHQAPLAQGEAGAAAPAAMLAEVAVSGADLQQGAADLMVTADAGTQVLVAATAEPPPVEPAAVPELPQPLVAEDCPVTLDLAAAPGAVVKITLMAPCAPNARVVLMHEGLAITGMTTATGALFAALPALAPTVTVEAGFGDGSAAMASLYLPEAAKFRRFGVQWQGDDAFQLQAFANGAGVGGAGHVNATRAGMASDAGGFLQVLGDPSAPMPLLAEIYTYPTGADPVEVQLESLVTFKTCARELLAETLMAQRGVVSVTDLSLAMPDCSATGDILVLNNLALDMTLASN